MSDITLPTIIKQIVVRENANSYEFGKAGNRIKVYFEDLDDLKKKVKDLKEAGFGADLDDAY